MKAPVISCLLAAAVVIACILPMSHMKLNYSYADSLPPGCISRSGYDAMIDAGFPSYTAVPLNIAIDGYDKPAVRAQDRRDGR